MFALVDANSFYASCEQAFRPELDLVPVVVASNNDGCVIARSALAKKLGIKTGDPIFKNTDLFRHHGVVCFSSNYELYGDMSHRLMSTLEEMCPRVFVYSIDEAFCDLTGVRNCRDLTVGRLSGRSTSAHCCMWALASLPPRRWPSWQTTPPRHGRQPAVSWIYQTFPASGS